MPSCIFCSCEMVVNNKPEHVLLDAFGGRFQTRSADCSACNSRFGETIDNVFAAQLTVFRNLHQLTSGSGRPPPKLPKVTIGSRQLCIKSDGTPEIIGKPFVIDRRPDGTWNLSIQARSEQHLQEIIPHIAAQVDLGEAELRGQLAASASVSILTEPAGIFENQLGLGGNDAVRSIVKSGMVLWSTLVGNEEVLSNIYDDARLFVREGIDKDGQYRVSLDTRDLPAELKIQNAFGPLFNMLFIRSDEKGRVVGHFTLYNIIGWQFILAENGGKPGLSVALVSNPESPKEWSREAAQQYNLPFAWINSPDCSDLVATERRLARAYQHYLQTARLKAVEKLADQASQDLGLASDQALSANEVEKLSSKLIDSLANFLLRTPSEEKLNEEKMTRLFEKRKRPAVPRST